MTKNPKIYAAIYFCLIPIFGFIYLLLPADSFKTELSMDNFITCLYYSAVTITTLGYGDISAVSLVAQILIIFETLTGVLMIGLFLNSLSLQQANELNIEEKKKEEIKKYKYDLEKILRHNKIIEQNIQFYLRYVYEISTPLSKRDTRKELNIDFTFNDLHELYNPSMRMADNHKISAVEHYFIHLENLKQSINKVVLEINFSHWHDLELKCIDFLTDCKNFDYSSSILSQTELFANNRKMSEWNSELIKEYAGEVEFRPSNILNQYIALFKSIKANLDFIEYYMTKIKNIKEQE